jgi:hypothetical protein
MNELKIGQPITGGQRQKMAIKDIERLRKDWELAKDNAGRRAFFFRKYGLRPIPISQMDLLLNAREDIEDGIREILNAEKDTSGSETTNAR